MKKVYVAYFGSSSSAAWMPFETKVVKNIEDADLVLYMGGGDISPSFYNETYNGRTWMYDRDVEEAKVFTKARELNIPQIGICRGAQLLCALSGGKLVQHLEHPSGHRLICNDGDEIVVNSIHHQLMFPYTMDPKDYEVLAYAEGLSNIHYNGNKGEMDLPKKDGVIIEPEICQFNNTKALGFQCHPEMIGRPKHGYYKKTVEKFDEFVLNFLK